MQVACSHHLNIVFPCSSILGTGLLSCGLISTGELSSFTKSVANFITTTLPTKECIFCENRELSAQMELGELIQPAPSSLPCSLTPSQPPQRNLIMIKVTTADLLICNWPWCLKSWLQCGRYYRQKDHVENFPFDNSKYSSVFFFSHLVLMFLTGK